MLQKHTHCHMEWNVQWVDSQYHSFDKVPVTLCLHSSWLIFDAFPQVFKCVRTKLAAEYRKLSSKFAFSESHNLKCTFLILPHSYGGLVAWWRCWWTIGWTPKITILLQFQCPSSSSSLAYQLLTHVNSWLCELLLSLKVCCSIVSPLLNAVQAEVIVTQKAPEEVAPLVGLAAISISAPNAGKCGATIRWPDSQGLGAGGTPGIIVHNRKGGQEAEVPLGTYKSGKKNMLIKYICIDSIYL